MNNLAAEDIDNLRHMLGVKSGTKQENWGYRNHWSASLPNESMIRLTEAGLVSTRIRRGAWGEIIYFATPMGCIVAGLSEKQSKEAGVE